MAHLGKADLEQMGEDYFGSLEPECLVVVAKNRPLAKLISAMIPSFSKTLRRSQLVIIESGN